MFGWFPEEFLAWNLIDRIAADGAAGIVVFFDVLGILTSALKGKAEVLCF